MGNLYFGRCRISPTAFASSFLYVQEDRVHVALSFPVLKRGRHCACALILTLQDIKKRIVANATNKNDALSIRKKLRGRLQKSQSKLKKYIAFWSMTLSLTITLIHRDCFLVRQGGTCYDIGARSDTSRSRHSFVFAKDIAVR